MGCSGSKAAPSNIIIAEGVEQQAGLNEYSTSVDDKGRAVTAGFVRQAQRPPPTPHARQNTQHPNASPHSRRSQAPTSSPLPENPCQHDHEVTPLSSKYDTAGAKTLGKGAFGVVQTCKRVGTAEVFALKTITVGMLTAEELQALQNEVDILRKLDHPAIVRIFETFFDRGEARPLAIPILY